MPSSPPPSDPYREALGLNLLALALKLDHVDRLSESLHLVDSTHMNRSVAVDINLARLTGTQMSALRASPDDNGARPPSIWLPLGRTARTDMAPIQVRDSGGTVLTTITHRATMRALGQGLRRAFMIWLDSDPDAHRPGHPLQDLRHNLYRSSWLIEAALTNLIENGSHGLDRHDPREVSPVTKEVPIRQSAYKAVNQLFASADNPFLSLLELVASEHLLVVEVSTAENHVFLRYDAPVLPALSSEKPASRQGKWRRLAPAWALLEHEFTVTYETVIPRAVNSYHATLEVPEELRVRRLLMSSDNDAYAVRGLSADLQALADRYDALKKSAPEILTLELHAIISRAAELGRRRHGELVAYKSYIKSCYGTFRHRAPKFRAAPELPKDVKALCEKLARGKRPVEHLKHLADLSESAGRLDELTEALDKNTMVRWAKQIDDAELRLDITMDNDPRENAGHTHWSRRPFGHSQESTEPVKVAVYAALVDDPPSLAASVGRLLVAVVALVAALILFIQLNPAELWRALQNGPGAPASAFTDNENKYNVLSSADALVTILLLVPGLLLSRLDIPSHRTVLGRLRLFSRYVAYAAVSVSALLALSVATRPATELGFPLAISLALLSIVVLGVLGDGALKAYKRRSKVPNNRSVPQWLIDEIKWSPIQRRRTAADFSTVGRSSDV